MGIKVFVTGREKKGIN